MTKTKPKKRLRKPPPERIAADEFDMHLVRLLTSSTGETQAELVARMMRDRMQEELAERGIDGAKSWAANRN